MTLLPSNMPVSRVWKQVNDSKADILLVVFGAPLLELWIYNNVNDLDCIALYGVCVYLISFQVQY